MRTRTLLSRLVLAGLLTTGLEACNKLLEVPPPDELSVDAAFGDSATAVAAITGIYNGMISRGYFECGALSYYPSRSADDAVYRRARDYFALDSLLYTNYDVGAIWSEGFSSLWGINTCIQGLRASKALSAGLYRRLLGESLFCRAFVNFYLVNLWGDALPLITSPDVRVNQLAGSVPRQKVYDQVIADLLEAQELLTNADTGATRVRPQRSAATALLARVYLYQQRYAEAIVLASALIGSERYTPLPAPAAAFRKESREAIWQLMPATGAGVSGAVADVYLYLRSGTSLTPALLAAFEPGDLRRQAWVVNNVFSGTTYTTANKYKDRGVSGNTSPSEYYIVLRLAEQYLIRAEAHARMGNTGAAIEDLNVIRSRAGLPALAATLNQTQCLLAVEQERRVELFTEWGHRWFDLRRWPGIANPLLTRADEILGAAKTDWQPTDTWYPVPRTELQVNPNLVQNPGYPSR